MIATAFQFAGKCLINLLFLYTFVYLGYMYIPKGVIHISTTGLRRRDNTQNRYQIDQISPRPCKFISEYDEQNWASSNEDTKVFVFQRSLDLLHFNEERKRSKSLIKHIVK